jgi:hypothetical protein
MKNLIIIATALILFLTACSTSENLVIIQPKKGIIEIPTKGETRVWQNIKHSSFEVEFINDNENQSCELYKVKSNGSEKWVSPSLLAKSKLTITIPKNGHLFIKNFNPNNLKITYRVIQ